MKNYSKIFAILSLAILTESCRKDDNEEEITPQKTYLSKTISFEYFKK